MSALEHDERGRSRVVNGVLYMLSMGICGTIIVALGSTLETLADNVGTTSTALGSLFIARGIGYVMINAVYTLFTHKLSH